MTTKILTKVKAIRANCKMCMGGPLERSWSHLVRNCTSRYSCPLWPHRFGMTVKRALKEERDVIP